MVFLSVSRVAFSLKTSSFPPRSLFCAQMRGSERHYGGLAVPAGFDEPNPKRFTRLPCPYDKKKITIMHTQTETSTKAPTFARTARRHRNRWSKGSKNRQNTYRRYCGWQKSQHWSSQGTRPRYSRALSSREPRSKFQCGKCVFYRLFHRGNLAVFSINKDS